MTETPMDKGFASKDELIAHLRGQIKEWVAERDYFEKLKNEHYELWKAAEVREQRLKEALEKVEDETRDEWIGVMIRDLLSTLYPDTPAPKEGE